MIHRIPCIVRILTRSVDTEAEEVGDDSSALAHIAGSGSNHGFCLYFVWNALYTTRVRVHSDDIGISAHDNPGRSAANNHLHDP